MDFVRIFFILNVFASVVSGHESNLSAFVFSLSSHDLSIHSIRSFYSTYLSVTRALRVWCTCKCTRNTVVRKCPTETASDCRQKEFELLCCKQPVKFKESHFHNLDCCTGFDSSPWHYAVHMAELLAVPGIWSCFMTSCPRAREWDFPFPVRSVQNCRNSELVGLLITRALISFIYLIFLNKALSEVQNSVFVLFVVL